MRSTGWDSSVFKPLDTSQDLFFRVGPSTVSPGQSAFFQGYSDLGPTQIVGRLGNYDIIPDEVRIDTPPPPPTLINITIGDDGSVQVGNPYNEYRGKVEKGQEALDLLGSIFQMSPDQIMRKYTPDQVDKLLSDFGISAQEVRDVYTRDGMNDYETINNLTNLLWEKKREAGVDGDIKPENLVMIGFNLAGVNKLDSSYKSGNAAYVLTRKYATSLAEARGGSLLGTWGTNVVVSGIPQDQVADFMAEVQRAVIEHIQNGKPFTTDEVALIGVQSAAELSIYNQWRNKSADEIDLGLSGGYLSLEMKSANITPDTAEVVSIQVMEDLGEREQTAKREPPKKGGVRVFDRVVPLDSPVKGKGARPLLKNTDSQNVDPVQPGQFADRTITPDDSKGGRLPRPFHDGGHSVGHFEKLKALFQSCRKADGTWDRDQLKKAGPEIARYLQHPEGGKSPSVGDFLKEGFQQSLVTYRFPDVIRIEQFPYVAQEFFGGEKGYIMMLEGKNMYGVFADHPPDKMDSLFRVILNVPDAVFGQKGLEMIMGMRGDEIYIAIKGKKKVEITGPDGLKTTVERDVTDEDIRDAANTLIDQNEKIFSQIESQQRVKFPGPGGVFDGAKFVVMDGKAYVAEKLPQDMKAFEALLNRVFGVDAKDVVVVKDLAALKKLGDAYRLGVYVSDASRPMTGDPTYIFLPENTAAENIPPGFRKFDIALQMTVSPAVEIPRGGVLDHTLMSMDMVGASVDRQKSLIGPDELPLMPVEQIPWYDRMESTPQGRLGLGAGYFFVGSTGANIVYGNWGKLVDPSAYLNMGIGFGSATLGEYLGEKATQYTFAPLLYDAAPFRRIAIQRGGLLGMVLFPQLLSGKGISWGETMKGLLILGGARLASKATLSALRFGLEQGGRIRSLSGLKNAAEVFGNSGPLQKVVTVVVEFVAILGIEKLIDWLYVQPKAKRQSREMERKFKGEYVASLREFDQAISEANQAIATGVDVDGKMKKVDEASAKMNDTFLQYFGFLLLMKTDVGKRYLKARMKVKELNQTLGENSMACGMQSGDNLGKSPCVERDEAAAALPDAEANVEAAKQELSDALPRLADYEMQDLISVRDKVFFQDGREAFIPMYAASDSDFTDEDYAQKLEDDPIRLYVQHMYNLDKRLGNLDPWGQVSGPQAPVDVDHAVNADF